MHGMRTRAELEQACSTIAATCACFTVRLASRAITSFYDAVLSPSGLRATQFVVLVGVFRGFGTTVTALGRALGMDRTSLSRNLRPLVRRGFVRTVQATDRRRRTVRTTKRGERLVARTIPYWQKAQHHVVATVGSDKWATLSGELRGLAKAIRTGPVSESTRMHAHGVAKRDNHPGVRPATD